MGFLPYKTPYDWSRLQPLRQIAQASTSGQIDVSIGSPVDPVPASVREAMVSALDAPNAHGYPATTGTPELREAITAWFARYRRTDLAAIGADYVPTVGSKEAVALMASLLGLGKADVVVQLRVSYPTYAIGSQLAGAQVLCVDDVTDTSSWEHVPGVKAVWVNAPNNPTGHVPRVEDLRRVVEAARRIGAVVLSDECYALLYWKHTEETQYAESYTSTRPAVHSDSAQSQQLPTAPCMLEPAISGGDASNILVLYSLSKQSNMAGYRTALIAGDAKLVGPMTATRRQIGQIIPGPVQAAMAAGLRDNRAIEEQVQRYRSRFERLVPALRDYGYNAHIPDGALYVWTPTIHGDCWDDMRILAQYGIIVSPGEFYGEPHALRWSVTVSDDDINLVIRQLRRATQAESHTL